MIERGFKWLCDRLGAVSVSAGYHSDLAGRVVPLSIVPDEPGAPLRPYVCVVPHDTGAIRLSEDLHTVTLSLRVALFPEPSESSVWELSEARAGFLLVEDVLRAVLPAHERKWDYGDPAISDVRIAEKEVSSRSNDGIPPFATLAIEIDVMLGRTEMGG